MERWRALVGGAGGLGADRAQVSRWGSGTEPIGSEMGRRIVDVHDVRDFAEERGYESSESLFTFKENRA